MALAVDKAFAEIDTNNNGTIDHKELLQHLLATGQEPETISELFAALDTNKDGEITRDEFAAGFEKYKSAGPSACAPSAVESVAAMSKDDKKAVKVWMGWAPRRSLDSGSWDIPARMRLPGHGGILAVYDKYDLQLAFMDAYKQGVCKGSWICDRK